jgi:hypothetical protein
MAIRLWAILFSAMTSTPSSKNDEDQEEAQYENSDLQNSTRLVSLIPALGCPLSCLLEIPVLAERTWA